MTHLPQHLRRNAIPYLVCGVVLVLGVGGGYAYAASKTKTITVCADKGTGVLHLKTHGRCKRGQTRVTWNQKGRRAAKGSRSGQARRSTRGQRLGASDQRRLASVRPGSLGAASSRPAPIR